MVNGIDGHMLLLAVVRSGRGLEGHDGGIVSNLRARRLRLEKAGWQAGWRERESGLAAITARTDRHQSKWTRQLPPKREWSSSAERGRKTQNVVVVGGAGRGGRHRSED